MQTIERIKISRETVEVKTLGEIFPNATQEHLFYIGKEFANIIRAIAPDDIHYDVLHHSGKFYCNGYSISTAVATKVLDLVEELKKED